MFKAVYRPSVQLPSGDMLLGTPFKEDLPEASTLREAFAQGPAGERPFVSDEQGRTVGGRVFVGVSYK